MIFCLKVVLFLNIFLREIQRLKNGVEVGNFGKIFFDEEVKKSFFILMLVGLPSKRGYVVFVYPLIKIFIVIIFIRETSVKFGMFQQLCVDGEKVFI